MSFRNNKWVLLALALAGIGSVLAGSIYLINDRTIGKILTQNSQLISKRWTEQLVKKVQGIDSIANGQLPSAADAQYLKFVAENNEVDHFDIYSTKGELRLESKKLGEFLRSGQTLAEHNSEVLEVVESGKPVTVVEVEDDEVLVETYMPITRDGKFLGVASVYVDQTAINSDLHAKMGQTSYLIAFLSLLGFMIPGAWAFYQTRRKAAAVEQAQYFASFDPLTDLPNRKAMESGLQTLLDDASGNEKFASLHFIDIDYFKEINDRHGHAFGDEVLKAFATRIKDVLKPGDVASRFGGDEFVLAQTNFTSIDDLALATGRLTEALSKPFEILGKNIVITSSIGTAMFPNNSSNAEGLMLNADIALYVVKMSGRNGQRFYEPAFSQQKKRRTELELLIREHAAARSFELHFQPLYNLKHSKLKGFEALLRMKDHGGKYVSPAEFVPIAEDIGLIDEIGAWVLDNACAQANTWPDPLQVSVNLSAVQFRRKSVCKAAESALRSSKLHPSRLLLEVTESLMMSDVEGVLEQLNALKALGTTLAMDDFGTGYSSLSYMMRFPFDRIKIDRSFINQLQGSSDKGRKIVQTIVSLGHNMNMAVTAEGVETASQAMALQAMKCDDVQGYLYSKPVPVADIAALILKDFEVTVLDEKPQKKTGTF
jgi:diguanylate cyclase (GGDEF)-like protein